jgi:hypothetical protein
MSARYICRQVTALNEASATSNDALEYSLQPTFTTYHSSICHGARVARRGLSLHASVWPFETSGECNPISCFACSRPASGTNSRECGSQKPKPWCTKRLGQRYVQATKCCTGSDCRAPVWQLPKTHVLDSRSLVRVALPLFSGNDV